jgi:hypothetical protein
MSGSGAKIGMVLTHPVLLLTLLVSGQARIGLFVAVAWATTLTTVIASLNTAKFGGYSDWRLPTMTGLVQ